MNFNCFGARSIVSKAAGERKSVLQVFVGSGIFKSENPEKRAAMIVQAVTHYNDAKLLAKVAGAGTPFVSLQQVSLPGPCDFAVVQCDCMCWIMPS